MSENKKAQEALKQLKERKNLGNIVTVREFMDGLYNQLKNKNEGEEVEGNLSLDVDWKEMQEEYRQCSIYEIASLELEIQKIKIYLRIMESDPIMNFINKVEKIMM